MLFKQHILDGIVAGRVRVAFRRWRRASVKAGGKLVTALGVLAIHSVEKVSKQRIKPTEVALAGFDSLDDLLETLGGREGDLYRIEFELAGEDPRIELRERAELSQEELAEIERRLGRLDRASKTGAWTEKVLRLIEQLPETRAAELARRSRFEKEWLKLNVRKLKNLGLTESLELGYRLSPRGMAFLEWKGR